ncbi:MAG: adenylate/guanylate cyclase domain-containing protein [Treponema sp.]|jgi:adenylate cyclase|nr:adenylate/guanylate cyclase domain-containing protein [Treponema sp.]
MAKKFKIFNKVGNTIIVPMGGKILLIFVALILLSNFATNFISLQLSQKQTIELNNKIMVAQLKELYTNCTNQYQIYSYSQDRLETDQALKRVAQSGFSNANSIALGINKLGDIRFIATNNKDTFWDRFLDTDALQKLNDAFEHGTTEGSISFKTFDGDYFGVYKYHEDWNYYLIRAEKRSDLEVKTRHVFYWTFLLIIFLTVLFIFVGSKILNLEFKTMKFISKSLNEMQKKKELGIIDLSDAPNDDVTYLAASFNSLSSSVKNLLKTFQKFVPNDVVNKAYSEKGVGLEMEKRELTMLFSDIKSFTSRTEILGAEIQSVLEVHYNRVIHSVHENSGVVGSIIGDAILAMFGLDASKMSKSYTAIRTAWEITRVTAALRTELYEKRSEVEKKRKLTASEEKVFNAISVDVGVGIDGGMVLYGTIGRNDQDPRLAHMGNTVIGDAVNSASRLEGLTRIYHLPVIVSEYLKNEVEKESIRYRFFEIDTVQVKGKTEGKKIYFPFDTNEMDMKLIDNYNIFEEGLKSYYDGDWKSARRLFKNSELECVEVFLDRMGLKNAPEDWSGIWTMTTK